MTMTTNQTTETTTDRVTVNSDTHPTLWSNIAVGAFGPYEHMGRTQYPITVDPRQHGSYARLTITVDVPFFINAPRTHDEHATEAFDMAAKFVLALNQMTGKAITVDGLALPNVCLPPVTAAPTEPEEPGARLYEVGVSRVVEVSRTMRQVARYTHERTITVLATSEQDAEWHAENMDPDELFSDITPPRHALRQLEWEDDGAEDEVDDVELAPDDAENSTEVQYDTIDAAGIRSAVMSDAETIVITDEAKTALKTDDRSEAFTALLGYAEALAVYEEHIAETEA